MSGHFSHATPPSLAPSLPPSILTWLGVGLPERAQDELVVFHRGPLQLHALVSPGGRKKGREGGRERVRTGLEHAMAKRGVEREGEREGGREGGRKGGREGATYMPSPSMMIHLGTTWGVSLAFSLTSKTMPVRSSTV